MKRLELYGQWQVSQRLFAQAAGLRALARQFFIREPFFSPLCENVLQVSVLQNHPRRTIALFSPLPFTWRGKLLQDN
ncbi:hypothetical protein [Pseudenterobacter timonensis]|uniref:hypothetical protein n=1 Tax=Pseudenterobacter timonensis TaxID=1755099 RepID=UPI002877C9EF|nr:hypothetical protein [Pseudenterobacter timonensis]